MSLSLFSPTTDRIVIKSILVWAAFLSCGVASGQTQPPEAQFEITTVAPPVIFPETLPNDVKLFELTVISSQLRNQPAGSIEIFLNQTKVSAIPEVL
jgi:hypothetical protein